jgi:transposase
MGAADPQQPVLFSVLSMEDRIPPDDPLRVMRRLVEPVLAELSPQFVALDSATRCPSIRPEQILPALPLRYSTLCTVSAS